MSGGTNGDALSLNRKLRNALTIVSAGLLVMAVWVVAPSLFAYVQAENDLEVIRAYQTLLIATEHMSAERGPSNVLMSIEPGVDADAIDRLGTFRGRTDRALAAAATARTLAVPRQVMIAVREDIATARRKIDAVAAKPLAERAASEIGLATGGLSGAVEHFHPAVASAATVMQQRNPALAGPASVALALSDLREFGGRLGSYLVPAIARRAPLADETVDLISRTHGRIEQLLRILQGQAIIADDPYRGLMLKVRMIFAGQGLRLIDTLTREGRQGGQYSIAPADFTDLYVPTLVPLETLRRSAVEGMVGHVVSARNSALLRLLVVSVITLLLLLVPVRMLYTLFRSVLRPLLTARDMIVALAEERPAAPFSPKQDVRELHNLFNAIAQLRVKLGERRALTETLRVQADTDFLTGLPNRSCFARAGKNLAAARDGKALGVHYIDLDGFKPVNDTFGHFVGDLLLKEVATRLGGVVGDLGAVARLGGDEFAVCASAPDRAAHENLARRILAAFDEPFHVEERLIPVGASIGVALAPATGMEFENLCQQADIALYAAKSSGRGTYRLFTPADVLTPPVGIDRPEPARLAGTG